MKLRDLIQKSVERIPYEGDEVDIQGMEDTIKKVMMGFVTFLKDTSYDSNGHYLPSKERYCSRKELVEIYLNTL